MRHVGETLRVLIDEEVPQSARQTRRRDDAEAGVAVAGVKFPKRTRFVGRTEYDAPEIDGVVFITDDDARPGEFVPVTIHAAQAYDLIGRVSTPTI